MTCHLTQGWGEGSFLLFLQQLRQFSPPRPWKWTAVGGVRGETSLERGVVEQRKLADESPWWRVLLYPLFSTWEVTVLCG